MGDPQRVFADLNPDGEGRFGTLIEEFQITPHEGERVVIYDDEDSGYPATVTSVDGRVVTFRLDH